MSFNATLWACEKAFQWQQCLSLLQWMEVMKAVPETFIGIWSFGVLACYFFFEHLLPVQSAFSFLVRKNITYTQPKIPEIQGFFELFGLCQRFAALSLLGRGSVTSPSRKYRKSFVGADAAVPELCCGQLAWNFRGL